MAKCKGSYRRGVEIIQGIYKQGIHPRDFKQIHTFLATFTFKEDLVQQSIKECKAIDEQYALKFFSVIATLRGPIHIGTLIMLLAKDQKEIDILQRLICISSNGLLTVHSSKTGNGRS